jgi:hypothetical protein
MKRVILIGLLLSTLLVVGCASRASFNYKPSDVSINGNEKLPLKVAVMPFEDKRGDKNTNAALLYLFPLFPFGPIDYDRPDGANGYLFHSSYNFRPSEDFAKATVDEFKTNNIFDEIFFTQREKEPNIDMLMTGIIRETDYNGKLISYGLSAYGPLLWFIGLPAGHITNTLDFSMELKRVSDGKIVWKHDVKKECSKVSGLYYNWAADFDCYPSMLKEGLVEGVEKLLKEIENNEGLKFNIVKLEAK